MMPRPKALIDLRERSLKPLGGGDCRSLLSSPSIFPCPFAQPVRVAIIKVLSIRIGLGPIPPGHELAGDVQVKPLRSTLEWHSCAFELGVDCVDDEGKGLSFGGLEEESVVVLEQQLDGEMFGGLGGKERPSPNAVEDEVQEFGNGGLGDKCNGFAEGLGFGGTVEEDTTTEEGGVKVLIRRELFPHPLMPLADAWKRDEVPLLELLNDPMRYAHSFGDAKGTTFIITTMTDAFGHVSILESPQIWVTKFCDCAVDRSVRVIAFPI